MLVAVTLKRPGGDKRPFYRAGMKFEHGEHVYTVTPAQLKAIKADTMLKMSIEHIGCMNTAGQVDAIRDGYRDRDIHIAAEERKAAIEEEAKVLAAPAGGIRKTMDINPQEDAYPLIDACETEAAVRAITDGDTRKGVKGKAEARIREIAEGGEG